MKQAAVFAFTMLALLPTTNAQTITGAAPRVVLRLEIHGHQDGCSKSGTPKKRPLYLRMVRAAAYSRLYLRADSNVAGLMRWSRFRYSPRGYSLA